MLIDVIHIYSDWFGHYWVKSCSVCFFTAGLLRALNMEMCMYYETPRKKDNVTHFPNILDYESFPVVHIHMTSVLRTTLGIGWYLSPLLNNHCLNSQIRKLMCWLLFWCSEGRRLSVTSSCGHTIDRTMSSLWLLPVPVASEPVRNVASCLPVQYPGGGGGGGRMGVCENFPGTFMSTKSPCTQNCVLAFPSRGLNTNLETLRRCMCSQSGYHHKRPL